ncbi:hypothetical protein SYNPS1DRAFT_22414 [Syncephalis pseudoplumigaleata]|uniref:Uncharacterized protein n=1 Tax=Syncephalis pseudoplumigaleata TaxID=1712513 RepID=A0A4P9YZQ1_9FUNG|nr:hypothetical protein SYNPS1DRAFT_22414 [Syncephalis pseudoplumigaleata]|eukprot:RKP25663.1 hypothetical protein SYNPS1DRAFT_22414 [Syncephalis pseudoplumigaleata]
MPLQTASYVNGDSIEASIGLFACFPLEALPATCQALVIDTVERRVVQILDTLATTIIDSRSRKKDINAIIALIKAFNLLSRLFAATWQTNSIRFATRTPHIDLTVRLAPAHVQEELARFMAKQATAPPSPPAEEAGRYGANILELDWLFDLLGHAPAQQASPLPIISTIVPAEPATDAVAAAAVAATSAPTRHEELPPMDTDGAVTLDACLAASHIVRKYIRLMRKQPLDAVDPNLVKSLVTLRRELDALDAS